MSNSSDQIICPHCAAINRVPVERRREHPKCGKCKQPIFTGHPLTLTDQSFGRHLQKSGLPVLVDFWAPWCGPCKMLGPIIEEISGEYVDRATVCKLNTDEARESAIEFGISAIPTTILFKGGQVQKKWVGLISKKDIVEAIDELL